MQWALEPVGAGFLGAAPFRQVSLEPVPHPADRVFEAIAGDPAGWGRWFPGFTLTGQYHGAPPHRPGSRRTMRMAGITYVETVLTYDPDRRCFAFRVDRAGAPFATALAEQYLVRPTAAGCEVEWTFAMAPRPAVRPFMRFAAGPIGRLWHRAATGLAATLDAAGGRAG